MTIDHETTNWLAGPVAITGADGVVHLAGTLQPRRPNTYECEAVLTDGHPWRHGHPMPGGASADGQPLLAAVHDAGNGGRAATRRPDVPSVRGGDSPRTRHANALLLGCKSSARWPPPIAGPTTVTSQPPRVLP